MNHIARNASYYKYYHTQYKHIHTGAIGLTLYVKWVVLFGLNLCVMNCMTHYAVFIPPLDAPSSTHNLPLSPHIHYSQFQASFS